MPELPEVEVTRRRLSPILVGRVIERVETTKDSYFFLTKPEALRRALTGRSVRELNRIGKYLLAELDDGDRLLLHLGMTGQLFSSAVSSVRLFSAKTRSSLPPEALREFKADLHTHLSLHFEDGGPSVLFRDVRKFGKVALIRAGSVDPRLDKLGVDALAADGQTLFRAARARKIPIKSLLLDQSVIAGIGNIYADEALFLAKVRPTRSARRVSERDCRGIVAAAQQVMKRSIATGGSSISDYVTPDGSDGGYQNERKVYARKGLPCLVCKTPIRRVVIATRSTHYCPECQV
ncbi:MAG TPA: bifunctional DNA-formamidopyrimidine glycosylase/DNA-(apurinic or apyrimidinic site) lyase [Polyangiaceae bacterium]|nr:bifunctional DNA-formamidopyrimidine glycosylase/DNA-(apurinic or apyrimidinic site) lyase [Polyangiaceae bacterium]